jgi:hypothetical protein
MSLFLTLSLLSLSSTTLTPHPHTNTQTQALDSWGTSARRQAARDVCRQKVSEGQDDCRGAERVCRFFGCFYTHIRCTRIHKLIRELTHAHMHTRTHEHTHAHTTITQIETGHESADKRSGGL